MRSIIFMKEYRDNDRENESSDEYSDTVLDVRNRKIIIIDGDSKSNSDAQQDYNNLE